ncbi:MAG: hypothetical protein P8Z81_04500 [Deinococcales bacterium]|jgi:hypothetical protein
MSSYSDEQRALLLDAAAEVLVAAVAAERTGPIAYFREIMAAGRYLYDARRRYSDNALVQDLFTHAEERSVELDEVTRDKLLARIEQVGAIVHDDAEGVEFKRFLLELAERVAEASRSGLFGRRLSPNEAAFLHELETRLRLPKE